jgi:hypothetical protein
LRLKITCGCCYPQALTLENFFTIPKMIKNIIRNWYLSSNKNIGAEKSSASLNVLFSLYY